MPQQPIKKFVVFKDSIHNDTVWLDYNALPTKAFNPVNLPKLVFFNVDTAIAHLVNWGKVDTFSLHKMERRDTIIDKSFFNIYQPYKKTGTPELNFQSNIQPALSATVLFILFASLSIIFTTSKNKLIKYLFLVFDKRKFKKYFEEENPRLLPTTPILYLIQSMVVGSIIAFWVFSKLSIQDSNQFIKLTLLVMLLYTVIPLLRNGFLMLLGNIFMLQEIARKHILVSYISHTLLFLLTIPLAIQLAIQWSFLTPYFNIAFYCCFVLVIVYQLVKLFQNIPLKNINMLLYIFLYFCTLEVLPLLLIYKMVSIYT